MGVTVSQELNKSHPKRSRDSMATPQRLHCVLNLWTLCIGFPRSLKQVLGDKGRTTETWGKVGSVSALAVTPPGAHSRKEVVNFRIFLPLPY